MPTQPAHAPRGRGAAAGPTRVGGQGAFFVDAVESIVKVVPVLVIDCTVTWMAT